MTCSVHFNVQSEGGTWHIFCSLYFKAKTQWNKGMSDFDSGNSVIVFYMKQSGKIIGPLKIILGVVGSISKV